MTESGCWTCEKQQRALVSLSRHSTRCVVRAEAQGSFAQLIALFAMTPPTSLLLRMTGADVRRQRMQSPRFAIELDDLKSIFGNSVERQASPGMRLVSVSMQSLRCYPGVTRALLTDWRSLLSA